MSCGSKQAVLCCIDMPRQKQSSVLTGCSDPWLAPYQSTALLYAGLSGIHDLADRHSCMPDSYLLPGFPAEYCLTTCRPHSYM